jgi:rod shape-determining protein MreD
MKRSHLYILLVAALLAQLTVMHLIKIFGAEPDLMLIIVIFFGFFFGAGAGLEAGVAAGIMKDIFVIDFFGTNAFVYGTSGLLAGLVSGKLNKESRMSQFVLGALFTAFSMSIHYILVSILSKGLALGYTEYLVSSILPVSAYTGLIAIPCFYKLTHLYGLRHLEELL